MSTTDMELAAQMQESVRHFFANECPASLIRALHDGGQAPVVQLWEQTASMGLPGALLDEEQDGLGLGLRDALRFAEQAGRALLPLPLTCIMVLLPFVLPRLRREHPDMAAMMDGWQNGDSWPALGLQTLNGQWLLEYGHGAQHALTVQCVGNTLTVSVIEIPVLSRGIDPSMPVVLADITSSPLCSATVACRSTDWLLFQNRYRLVRLAELLGVAAKALDMGVAHATERTQFGRPIGANQAIKHTLANQWMSIDNARLSLEHAAQLLDNQQEPEAVVDFAHILTMDAARSITKYAVQVFGAMGVTWECDVHLYLKRAHYLCAILERGTSTETALERIWELG